MASDNHKLKSPPSLPQLKPAEGEDQTVVTSAPERLPEPQEDPYIGKVFGDKYHILEQVGRGGIGLVYRATQKGLNRDVVIKLLKQESQHDHSTTQRFSREAQALSLLNHNNIVGVYDFGQEGDLSYIVMEYIDGVSLDHLIKQMGKIPLNIFAPIARQILDAVGEAHGYGIIHRDIKPSNIMLTSRKGYPYYVKVLDFGLVKLLSEESDLTGQHKLVGTIAYLSPEQILGGEADQRVDVYALGVLFYHMLSGQKPFRGRDMTVLYQHIHQEATPLVEMLGPDHHIPEHLIALVHRCLAKEPAQRPADANALLDELLNVLDDASLLEIPSGEFSSPSIPNLRALRGRMPGDPSYERSSSDVIPNRLTDQWGNRDISASSPSISRPGLEMPSSPSISRDGFDAPPIADQRAQHEQLALEPLTPTNKKQPWAIYGLVALALITIPLAAFFMSQNGKDQVEEPAASPPQAQRDTAPQAPAEEAPTSDVPTTDTEAKAAPDPVMITFKSNAQAKVLINGKALAETTGSIKLKPDTYNLSVVTEGFEPWTKSIEVVADTPQTIEIKLDEVAKEQPKTSSWRNTRRTPPSRPKVEDKPKTEEKPKIEDKPKTEEKPQKKPGEVKLLTDDKVTKPKGEFELLKVSP